MRTAWTLVALGSWWFGGAALAAAPQDVWVVDDGGGAGVDFTQIQAAVDAASDGDTVLVRTGTYASFLVVGKALTVSADVGQAVAVAGFSVRALATSQSVVVRRVTVAGASQTDGAVVLNCAGPVWIEACTLQGANGHNPGFPAPQTGAWAGARVGGSASVVFARCTLLGGVGPSVEDEDVDHFTGDGGAGLAATASNVAVHDCALEGGRGGDIYDTVSWPAGHGGRGCLISGGSLFASGSSFKGGSGGFGDCETLFGGCGSGGNGGHGLHLATGSPLATLLDDTFTGASGGQGGGSASDGSPGQPTKVDSGTTVPLAGASRPYVASSPVRELEDATFAFEAAPGELAFVLYGPTPAHLELLVVGGVLVLSPLNVGVLSMGAIPASGTLTSSITIPLLTPTLEAATLFTQALFFDAGSGSAHLGPASALTIVDEAL